MIDIKDLREVSNHGWPIADDAADEIERLENINADLLSALKELLDREWQDDNGEETLERARYKARDAIVKAEGKS